MEKISLGKFNEFSISRDALSKTKAGGTACVEFHKTYYRGGDGALCNQYRTYDDNGTFTGGFNVVCGPNEPPCEPVS